MSTPKILIPWLPGTNCHEESAHAISLAGGAPAIIPYRALPSVHEIVEVFAAIFLAGGFSWGDHYGAGRVAGMLLRELLKAFAETGKPILGTCNGFQIEMEAGLFDSPNGESGGALVTNTCGTFVTKPIELLAGDSKTPWTEGFTGKVLKMPTAHGEGRWRRPAGGMPPYLKPFFYYSLDGVPTESPEGNPNGTPGGIAGLINGNVAGMMPHPERAVDILKGSEDGRLVIEAFVRMASTKA